jgi:hypothetical protein
MTDRRAAAVYALVLLPTWFATLAVGGWVMDVWKQTPRLPSGVFGWAINILPASLIGLLVYLALGFVMRPSRPGLHPFAVHARRSAPLYAVALALGALILHDAGSPEFWSFGQLALWIWLATVAGIIADGLTVLRRPRSVKPVATAETDDGSRTEGG